MARPVFRWIKLLVKTAIALALVAWVVYSADVDTIGTRLRQANGTWLGIAVIVMLSGNLLGGLRIYMLVRPRLAAASFWALSSDYFIGFFFNAFLPTSAGGDIARAVYLSRYGMSIADAASAVLVERLFGLAILVFFPLVGTAMGAGELPREVAGGFFLGSTAIGACVLLLFSRRVDRLILARFAQSRVRLFAAAARFARAVHQYRRPRRALALVALCTIAYQFVAVAAVFALGQALAPDVGLGTYMLLYPVVALATMLPISVNGTGIRESAFVLLFSQAGMARETASAVSLLLLALVILQAIVGAAFFLSKRTRTPIDLNFADSAGLS